jgi:hypothetical protein
LIAEGGYGHNPELAARVLRVTIEGMWLEFVFATTPYSREEALSTAYLCASALFPKHFGPSGLLTAIS